ncbi:MAG TPA: hypothetical protein VEC56_02295 [Candidatus Krumholzibacteria bacterium]|nr:hypothetical protein [Candidatus Krumholzibacteria bacterium]
MAKPTQPETPVVAPERASAHPGWWTSLAVLTLTWLGIPFLAVGAAFPWYLFRRANPELSRGLTPAIRWGLAAWVTAVAMTALAGSRALRAIPFGADAASSARAWIEGSGAVPSWTAMAIATVVFAAAAAVSPGILGAIALIHVVLITAVHAAVVFSSSSNVLGACVVALPVWSALLLAGMITLLEPLGQWGETTLRRRRGDGAPTVSRTRLMVGAGLIGAAFAARLVLAEPLGDLLRRVTLP